MAIDALFNIIIEITFLYTDSNNISHQKTIQETIIDDLGFYYWDSFFEVDYDKVIITNYIESHPLSNEVIFENNDYTRKVKQIGFTDEEYDKYLKNKIFFSDMNKPEEYERFISRNFYMIPKSIESAFMKEYIFLINSDSDKEYADFLKKEFINSPTTYFYKSKSGPIGLEKPNKNIVKIETKMIKV